MTEKEEICEMIWSDFVGEVKAISNYEEHILKTHLWGSFKNVKNKLGEILSEEKHHEEELREILESLGCKPR